MESRKPDGKDASVALVEAAWSHDPAVSLEAARALAAQPEPARFEAMISILCAPNSLVGDVAANALRDYGERGLPPLLAGLPAAKPLTQVKIVTALEHIGSREAVGPLMDMLAKTDIAMLRTLIIQALGSIGAVQAIPLIRSFADDQDHHVQERVRIALERLEHE